MNILVTTCTIIAFVCAVIVGVTNNNRLKIVCMSITIVWVIVGTIIVTNKNSTKPINNMQIRFIVTDLTTGETFANTREPSTLIGNDGINLLGKIITIKSPVFFKLFETREDAETVAALWLEESPERILEVRSVYIASPVNSAPSGD